MGSAWLGVMSKLPGSNGFADNANTVSRINSGIVYDVPFTIEHSFQNGFPYPVSIMFRNGLGFTIPKAVFKWRANHDFTVFVKYKFSKNVKFDIHHLLDDVDDTCPVELKTLKEAFRQSGGSVVLNGSEAIIAYHVSKASFEKSKGSLYLEDLDITLASDQDTQSVRTVHPSSKVGNALFSQIDQANGYSYRIVINDPNSDFGSRYINICSTIYKVPAQIDYGKDPGVYLHYTDDDGVKQEKIFTFETADAELMMYKNRSDAKVYGNILEARKRELDEIQHNQRLKVLELEGINTTLRAEFEERMAALKVERATMEADYAKLANDFKQRELAHEKQIAEMENHFAKEKAYRDDHLHRMKLEYEQRSLDRKDSSEIVKWLPVILTGGFLVFKKLF
jgi:hypothetical protein